MQDQARRTPPPHWVQVIGGWSAAQFVESASRRSTRSTPRPATRRAW
jgi:hypothetical protein